MLKKKVNEKLTFDLPNLELIYNDLVQSIEEDPDKNKDLVCERIREMTEFQLWGEKNNDLFFDFFCEKNVMELMLKLLQKSHSRDIAIQIILSLSMYLTNIKKPININYVLSNNSINEFITHSFGFSDDETVDYYISFLKSLALRLEMIPLELFYNQYVIYEKRYKNFPLMSQAIKFYNYPASMVRTSVQNITLTLFRLEDKKLQSYFTNFPFVSYFVNICCYLRDIWLKIDKVLSTSNINNHSKLKELLDDQIDMIMYIDDIFQLQKEGINAILANSLIHYAIIPALIAPFTSDQKGLISLNLSLYLINLLLNSINHPPIVEFLVTILFSKKLDKNLLEQSKTVPKDPISYLKEWSFNTPWDRYENILSEKHLAYLERFERRPSSGGRKISTESLESAQANKELEESRKNLLESVETREEFESLTKFTGAAVDIFNEELQELTQLSCVKLIQEFQSKFSDFGQELEGVELHPNPIHETFISFLKAKDDNMIMLMCNILNTVFNHTLITKKLYAMCNLVTDKHNIMEQLNKEEGDVKHDMEERNETVKFVLDCLFQLLIIDPPFRIATMRLITKIILDLSPHNKDKTSISPENLRIFNTGYKNSIAMAMKYIQNSITADFFVELFDIQWRNIYKKDFHKLDKRDYIYMLLPVIEEPVPGVDSIFRIPAGEYELAKREISIFLLFRKIRYSLIKTTKHSPQFIDDYNSGLRKENESNYWEENKFYPIENRKLIPCTLEENGAKTSCYIVEDEENFVVIKPDPNRIHWAQVLTNTKLKNTEVITNNSQILTVTIKIKDKYVDKNYKFMEQTLCDAAKRTLEENRRYSKHYEITVLIKHFEYAKNDLVE